MNAQASIGLDHVDKILGKAKRVDDLSLELAAGKIYGLLGPNGSGKTTILHLICGLYKPDRGTIRVLGMDPVRDHKVVRSAIGLLPQSTALYPELSARENLRFHAALYLPKGADAEARICEILRLVDLEARADEPVKNYSGGMSRRLGIGRALLNDPQILLLDEPTLGVDVQSTHRIHEYIRALGRAGKTVVVATNIMAEADALCDEVVIIDRGRKICAGAPQQLKDALGAATIQLRLKAGSAHSDAALQKLLGDFHREADGTLVVSAPHGEQDLAKVLEALAGTPIERITLQKPSLDDVFLHHTGRNLRE